MLVCIGGLSNFPKKLQKVRNFRFHMSRKRKSTSSTKNSQPSTSEDADEVEQIQFNTFMQKIATSRSQAANSIMEFKFSKKRARVLSKSSEFPEWGQGVIYWMFREQRVQDNWALLYAQKLAIKNQVPLHVCFCRLNRFLDATIRHFEFIFAGLQEVEEECKSLNIEFHFLLGCGSDILPAFVAKHKIGAVVIDFSPLKLPMKWAEQLVTDLPEEVPLIQVDGHNIVPCWYASDKREYAARTIRTKINNKLSEFLTEFPPVVKHPYKSTLKADSVDWTDAGETLEVDRNVPSSSIYMPGFVEGMKSLYDFTFNRIYLYEENRNDPTKNAVSNLSPWLHFGQISPQRCVLTVQQFAANSVKCAKSVQSFREEIIVRRELSDNFCYYTPNYDQLDGAENWAQKTLNDHRRDKREYVYSVEELEAANTHDNLWNAAQKQMMVEGKMHGFLRMYWAKKILEWTSSPEQALAASIYLNDKYSLDGRDPNGYVGCMWSICGIHDQGWRERSVFGKVRYMNYEGCKRKFNVVEFIERYANR